MGTSLIAVVDDDALVRSATTSLLRSLDFDCCDFGSADAFLGDRECAYDCVISDVQMPGMSGIDLAILLHQRPDPPPVILITAYPNDRASGLRTDGTIVELLEKPLDADAFEIAIRTALAGRRTGFDIEW